MDFYVRDKRSGVMRRKKYMLSRYKSVKERDAVAAQLMAELYAKLSKGWSPFAPEAASRGDARLMSVLELYRNYLAAVVKKKVITAKTCRDWLSRVKLLEDYISQYSRMDVMCCEVDKDYITEYLDYILLDRDVSARTRNNHRGWLSSLCGWMVERRFLKDNPVTDVAVLAEHGVYRQAISRDDLHRLREYLWQTNRSFLLAVMMEYYTFIRPNELSNIRIRDISVKEQTVFVSAEISKNRRDGVVALNDKIVRLMIELGVFNHPGDEFLFGRKFTPSAVPAMPRHFSDYFVKVRRQLGFPENYQFYSLKNSGIRDLANERGIVVARDQARHSDVSVTNRYLQGRDKKVDEGTKHFEGEL